MTFSIYLDLVRKSLLSTQISSIEVKKLIEQKNVKNENESGKTAIKSLLVVFSYHTNSTMKVAQVLAEKLTAPIKNPNEISHEELLAYDLVGFGSGIYDAMNHKTLLKLADSLPMVSNKKAFIFSTAGVSGEKKVRKDHKLLRSKLQNKGFTIVGEFGCLGYNRNSFLKYFGGMNKGRPNAEDLGRAEIFTQNLL